MENLTEADIQARLAGTSISGPRTFRGQTLAPYTKGLRDLHHKVTDTTQRNSDTGTFYDAALLYILREAFAEKSEEIFQRRVSLISATDDVPTFRARVSLFLDDLTEVEIEAARELTLSILEPVAQAQVTIAGPKKKGASKAKPSRTKTPS